MPETVRRGCGMAIELNELSFAYFEESKNLFDSFSASFDRGQITVLSGQSGCGKSTLLYLAAGIYPGGGGILRSGSVRVEGEELGKLDVCVRTNLVGMMFQNPELQFCMDTVRNELIFCLENVRTDPGIFEKKMAEALDFCGIAHLKDRTLISLSGGEKQKVMLACLFMLDPKWLLLDEPFANIDDESAAEIAGKLRELHERRGTGILAVDHRLDYWIDIAGRYVVLKDGALVEVPCGEGSGGAFAERMEQLGVIVPGRPYHPDLPGAEPGETVLTLSDFSVRYGEREILKKICYSFRRGVIYSLVGKSGAGKSTLFHALSGVLKYSGSTVFRGRDLRRMRRADFGTIGFVTQNPQDQFIGATVRGEILESLRGRQDAAARSEEILREIRLWRYRDISQYLLSQGQQRRLGVAALLAYDCEILICDEPAYAQDRENTLAVMEGLCKKAREIGAAMIFSTHDEQLAREFSDVRLRLEDGRLLDENAGGQLLDEAGDGSLSGETGSGRRGEEAL